MLCIIYLYIRAKAVPPLLGLLPHDPLCVSTHPPLSHDTLFCLASANMQPSSGSIHILYIKATCKKHYFGLITFSSIFSFFQTFGLHCLSTLTSSSPSPCQPTTSCIVHSIIQSCCYPRVHLIILPPPPPIMVQDKNLHHHHQLHAIPSDIPIALVPYAKIDYLYVSMVAWFTSGLLNILPSNIMNGYMLL